MIQSRIIVTGVDTIDCCGKIINKRKRVSDMAERGGTQLFMVLSVEQQLTTTATEQSKTLLNMMREG